jgi:hypothetical protein
MTRPPTVADAQIADALARFQELDAEFDRALDDVSISKPEMLRIKGEWNLAWAEYADACRDAGICVRPDCQNSVVVANQRICPSCRGADR